MIPALWLFESVDAGRDVAALPSGPYEYLKLIVVFALVLVFVFFLLRVWLPRMTGVRQISSGPIQVVARYPLEPRKNLYIVHAAGGHFLVGTSESGVHYLTTLDSDALQSSLPNEVPVAAAPLDFRKLMSSIKRPSRPS